VVNYKVNKAGLVDIVETLSRTFKEDQQKLDVYNEIFIQTLINREIVCGIASEEMTNLLLLKEVTIATIIIGINRSTRWVIKYRRERFCGTFFQSIQE
jgi:fructose-1,6-bisphosphatase